MKRMKTFFIYFLLVVIFFIYSQAMIYLAINSTYQHKSIDINTELPVSAQVIATSVNGKANIKVTNNTENIIENKYIKLECYSKNNVLMGTKYIKIDKIETDEEKEFEVRFNFNKVDRAVISIVEEQELTDAKATEEQKESDPQMGLAALI